MSIRLSGRPDKVVKKLTEENVNFENKEGLGEIVKEITPELDVPFVPTIKEIVKEAVEDLKNHDVSKENVEEQTGKLLEKVHQSAVMHSVKNNEDIQKKVLESAEEHVMSEIDINKNKQYLKVVKATYDANKDACENLGLSDEGRPMWQIRVAKAINNFWFIVWAIISAFTLTPIIFFLKRIGTQVKSAKLTWLLTFVFYLFIIFLIFMGVRALWMKLG